MEQYLLSSKRSLDEIIAILLKNSKTNSVDGVSKMILSGMFGWELEEKDFAIPEELYDEKIVLPEYDYATDNKKCLELAKILIDNNEILEKDNKERDALRKVLDSKTIEYLLINRSNSTVNKKVFYALCDLRADMTGVDFSGVYIHGLDFRGLKNVTIDIQKVKNKDLINTNLAGVKLMGRFTDCKLFYTRFAGCKPEYVLNPQKIAHKSMMCTDFRGVAIDGSFDGAKISNCNFSGATGNIRINPQTIYDKNLEGLILRGCYLIGDLDNISSPSFKGCKIRSCDFNGLKNRITINLDDLEYYTINGHDEHWHRIDVKTKLYNCNLINTTLTGNVLTSELDTIIRSCSTYRFPTWPNKSASIEEINGRNIGFCLSDDDPILLKDLDIYDRKNIDIRINIIDKKEEKIDEFNKEEVKANNQKKLKKVFIKKRLLKIFKGNKR